MATGENLRLIRVVKNYPQKYVADKLEQQQPTYHRYETDSREVPDDCVHKASALYNIPVELIKSPHLIIDLSLIPTGAEKELIKQLRTIKSNELSNDERKKAIVNIVAEWLGKGE